MKDQQIELKEVEVTHLGSEKEFKEPPAKAKSSWGSGWLDNNYRRQLCLVDIPVEIILGPIQQSYPWNVNEWEWLQF